MPWQEASKEQKGFLQNNKKIISLSLEFKINFTETDNTDTKEYKNTIKLIILWPMRNKDDIQPSQCNYLSISFLPQNPTNMKCRSFKPTESPQRDTKSPPSPRLFPAQLHAASLTQTYTGSIYWSSAVLETRNFELINTDYCYQR